MTFLGGDKNISINHMGFMDINPASHHVSFTDLYLSLHCQGKACPWETGDLVSRDVLTDNFDDHTSNLREWELI